MAMKNREDRVILRRLKVLSEIEPDEASARLALDHARAAAQNLSLAAASRTKGPGRIGSRRSHFVGGLTMRQRIAIGGAGLAALLGLVFLWGMLAERPASAMEKMAAGICKAKSYEFKYVLRQISFQPPPGRPAAMESRGVVYWIAPGSSREESAYPYDAWDGPGLRRVDIAPHQKPNLHIDRLEETYYYTPARQADRFSSVFEDIEKLGAFSAQADRDLGLKQIGGKQAHGFQIDNCKLAPKALPGRLEIWLDVQSNLPMLIRHEVKFPNRLAILEESDIQWNIDLDPALFDTTPPKGYTLESGKPWTLADQLPPIIDALKIYAELSGGHYPPTIYWASRPVEDLCRRLGLGQMPRGRPQGKAGKAGRAIRGFGVLAAVGNHAPDFDYHGQTVGPDDKEKILLRWKLDHGRYEVLFGDLRAETVTAERLRKLEGN
jgi:hypothetical protein